MDAELAGLLLRSARLGDGQALNKTCHPRQALEDTERSLAESLAQMKAGRGLWLVAEWEGEIVGSARLVSWLRGAEIADLTVLPRFRGRGIGRALVERLLEEAQRLGIPAVEIGADLGNRRALSLYERLGFAYRRTIHLAAGGGQSAVVYLEKRT
jgi:ribosomal-protein-alanine N-acetyltransferase